MANTFALLENTPQLSHAYLCMGDFDEHRDAFEESLRTINLRLHAPGHFVFIGNTFGKSDADDLIAWYHRGATAEDPYTIAVLAAGTLKSDAQQMLLKIFEEAKHPYIFFLFAPHGTQILETIRSRCTIIELGEEKTKEDVSSFVQMSAGQRISHVAGITKNKESHQVRTYTEELVRDLIHYFHQKDISTHKDILSKLLQAQTSLTAGHIAPKFILDYVITVI